MRYPISTILPILTLAAALSGCDVGAERRSGPSSDFAFEPYYRCELVGDVTEYNADGTVFRTVSTSGAYVVGPANHYLRIETSINVMSVVGESTDEFIDWTMADVGYASSSITMDRSLVLDLAYELPEQFPFRKRTVTELTGDCMEPAP